MRLDLRNPTTYLVLIGCFLFGFCSFFAIKLLPGAIAQTGDAQEIPALVSASPPAAASPAAAIPSNSKAVPPSASTPKTGIDRFEQRSKSVVGQVPLPASTVPPTPPAALSPSTPQASSSQSSPSQSSASINNPALPVRSVTDDPVAQSMAPVTNVNTTGKVGLASRQPAYEIAWADPTNYGDRFAKDIDQKPANHLPIIVLHETVSSADSAIAFFQTPHPNDEDQASYHTLIRRNGTVVYLVPPEKRAYGAGNSIFVGVDGQAETVKTHPKLPPSVNNFAYHISLESPPDGYGDEPIHSGYTQAQYDSLAWLIGQSRVSLDRITTHQAIDRSGDRFDPRSFEVDRLRVALAAYR